MIKNCYVKIVTVIRWRGVFYGDKDLRFEVDESVYFLIIRFNDICKLEIMVIKYNYVIG